MSDSNGYLDNTNAAKHGASGVERRIEKGLPLAEDDRLLHRDIVNTLGFNPDDMPSGALGLMIDLIADNVLLSVRFKGARHWAAEQGDIEAYERLAQRSGWRNDKAINQLAELAKLQADDKTLDYEAILQDSTEASQTQQD